VKTIIYKKGIEIIKNMVGAPLAWARPL